MSSNKLQFSYWLALPAVIAASLFVRAAAHPTIWEPGKPSTHGQNQPSATANAGKKYSSVTTSIGSIDKYFFVGEGVGEVKSVSNEFVYEIKNAVRELPVQFQNLVFSRGVIIYIFPTVMDRPLSMKARSDWPKGFPKDCQYWSLPGTYRGNSITVGEYVVRKDNSYKRLTDGRSNVRHEFGHALDTALKRFSHDDVFVEAYQRDMRNLTPEQRSHIRYYLPDRHGGVESEGRHEAFAELFAARYGKGETSTERKVLEAFPNTIRAMDRRLQEAISSN
jgi:hypothetical protein